MLVKIMGKENQEVLTVSSRQIAEDFEKRHADVLSAIDDAAQKLNSTGNSVQYFISSSYKDDSGKTNREVLLTRDGFSLIVMGFTGSRAFEWKLKYIEAFNEMEAELKRLYAERQKWEIERAKGVMIRHILTDTIKMKIADSPHKRFAYPNYTKLIYRAIFGKPLKELEQEYGVKPKESIRDYLNAEQLREVESVEMLVSGLINVGMGYEEIKAFLEQRLCPQLKSA